MLTPANYRGAPRGMWLRGGPDAPVPDGAARMLVDVLVDRETEIRARGPLTLFASYVITARGTTILSARDPNGNLRIMLLDTVNQVTRVYDSTMTQLMTSGTPQAFTDGRGVDVKPALGGNVWITAFSAVNPSYAVAEWGGASAEGSGASLTYTQGTLTFTTTNNLTAGMVGGWLHAGSGPSYLIGQIASITSATAGTLVPGSLRNNITSAGAPWVVSVLKGFQPLVGAGKISAETNSAIVFGSPATKFVEQGVVANASVPVMIERTGVMLSTLHAATAPTQTVLTLATNSALKVENESYFLPMKQTALTTLANLVDTAGVTALGDIRWTPGKFTAVYANRQWYANRSTSIKDQSTVWYSELGRQEVVDLSNTGGIPIGDTSAFNDPIINIVGAPFGLLIFKRESTYLLTGNGPSSFVARRIQSDGLVSFGAYGYYKDGVVWAGYKGLYYHDGGQVTNVTAESMGVEYARMMKRVLDAEPNITPKIMVHRDHVWLALNNLGLVAPFNVRRP